MNILQDSLLCQTVIGSDDPSWFMKLYYNCSRLESCGVLVIILNHSVGSVLADHFLIFKMCHGTTIDLKI